MCRYYLALAEEKLEQDSVFGERVTAELELNSLPPAPHDVFL